MLGFRTPGTDSFEAWTTMSEIFLKRLPNVSAKGSGEIRSSLPLLLRNELKIELFF